MGGRGSSRAVFVDGRRPCIAAQPELRPPGLNNGIALPFDAASLDKRHFESESV